jgi:hypothetical protein
MALRQVSDEVTSEQAWTVIDAYFQDAGLTRPQIFSFEFFAHRRIPEILSYLKINVIPTFSVDASRIDANKVCFLSLLLFALPLSFHHSHHLSSPLHIFPPPPLTVSSPSKCTSSPLRT